VVLILLVALFSGLAQARPTSQSAPGDLDLTFAGFGAGGLATITADPNISLFGMALQPDGKIVVVGCKLPGIERIVVLRYLSNGVLDTTFDGDGGTTVSYPGFGIRALAVAVQRDGRIVVAGVIFNHPGSFLVARLTKAGALDPSFGNGGFVITDFDSKEDVARAVVIQPDGKVVVAGHATVGGDEDFAVARYTATGNLDTNFSGDGKATIGFGGDDEASDIALHDDGKLVLVGQSTQGLFSDFDFAVARLNIDGSLDNSFNGDGKFTSGFLGGDHAEAVAIQTDGKIVAAGGNHVERYLPNGLLDTSFGGAGIYHVASSDELRDIAAQPDGKIVLLGTHKSLDNTFKFSFWRLNPDASLDTTFDGDGDAFFDLHSIFGTGTDLALQPDGRLLALGSSGRSQVLMRIWPDATLDTGGQQTMGYAESGLGLGSDETANGMALQPDGKIVVAGEISNQAGTESDLALARFLSDGQLDDSFGNHGRVQFGFGQYDRANAVVVQPDGKIVVAGTSDPPGISAENFLIARFNPDGTKDESFGLFGFNIVDFLGNIDRGFALALAPDGKIVVAGFAWNAVRNRSMAAVARLTSDGVLDTTFDGDGRVVTEWPMRQQDPVTAVVAQPDGKIVLGSGYTGPDFALMRLNQNGSVDSSFGSQGVTITDMGGHDLLYALALAPNGHLYAAGNRSLNGDTDFALAQYTPNGVLADGADGWPGGKVLIHWNGSGTAFAIDLRGDEQLVAAGCERTGIIWAQLPMKGVVSAPIKGSTDFAGSGECALGVKFSGANTIITAGIQAFNDDINMALARFETTTDPTAPTPGPSPIPRPGPGEPRAFLPRVTK
jgi:uncharacterized delta-60 repeat protein